MHWNEAEHTCGNRIGPMVQLARALCWDFRWSVRTSGRFGLLGSVYRHGHTQLGVVDRLFQAAEKAVHESLLPRTAFSSWLWPSEHNDHTGWKPPDVQKQPTIFWGLPDSMVNPDALQKAQAVPRNVRVIATVGVEKLQQKDWTGVQQQGSLSVPVKKLMEIREKVIELGHAQYQLKQVGIDSLRSMNRQTAGGASVPPAQRPWEHQSGGRPESAPAVGSVGLPEEPPPVSRDRAVRRCKGCLREGRQKNLHDEQCSLTWRGWNCTEGCSASCIAALCPHSGGNGACIECDTTRLDADKQRLVGSSAPRDGGGGGAVGRVRWRALEQYEQPGRPKRSRYAAQHTASVGGGNVAGGGADGSGGGGQSQRVHSHGGSGGVENADADDAVAAAAAIVSIRTNSKKISRKQKRRDANKAAQAAKRLHRSEQHCK